jgi:DNA-binding CsgD family transcriptional regulator
VFRAATEFGDRKVIVSALLSQRLASSSKTSERLQRISDEIAREIGHSGSKINYHLARKTKAN